MTASVAELFTLHFMRNALEAGTAVAVVAGAVGWFMVLRQQSFAGHTLAVVAFPGAAGAIWLGVSVAAGYFAAAVAGALVIASVPRAPASSGDEPAVVGTVQAVALAGGVLFVSLYGGFLNTMTALLFGTLLGVTDGQVLTLGVVALAALVVLAAIGRPLLFASVDPDVAQARGVRVRVLSACFLVLLGVTAAEASQITGTLLVFALLVMPAATAQRLTSRVGTGLALSVALALVFTWTGLVAAFYSDAPVGFTVTTAGMLAFALATAHRVVLERSGALGPVGAGP